MSWCLKVLRIVRVPSVIMLGSMTLDGCAASRMMIRYGSLNAQTEMSESVFLELRSDLPQTVYISEVSTAGRELTIRPTLDRQLTKSGYTLVGAPDEATYIIQINHLRLAESELTGDQTVTLGVRAQTLEQGDEAASCVADADESEVVAARRIGAAL